MSRRTTAALTLMFALSLPAIGVAAKPPKPPKPGNTQLTLAASPSPINFGGSTVLTGKLADGQASGQAVAIEASPAPFAAFKQITTATTNANGSFSTTVKPGTTTRYRATSKTAPPTTSNVRTVDVRIRVGVILSDATPRRGTHVVFSGRAYPAHDGALVSIQRRTSTGSYTTIARTRLVDDGTSRSRYHRAVRVSRSGVYRVRASNNSDNDHVPGYSRARRTTVA